MKLRITLDQPTRIWSYWALAVIIGLDTAIMERTKTCGWAVIVAGLAVGICKGTMATLICNHGFRISMDAWSKKRKREREAEHARFVAKMDQMTADSRERQAAFMRWWEDQQGDGWKRGRSP